MYSRCAGVGRASRALRAGRLAPRYLPGKMPGDGGRDGRRTKKQKPAVLFVSMSYGKMISAMSENLVKTILPVT